MADLITNLQSIYNTKLQIKDAIGTDSDIFADYPSYINSLKPTGYAYITTNGDHNVNAYSYVNVNVPTGGATVLGNLSITENGQYSASAYSYDGFDTVDVNVPLPTLGSANITANGNYSAHDLGYDGLNSVIVNVPTGGSSTHTLSVSGEYGMCNGKYYIYDTNLMTYLTLLGPITNAGFGDTVSGTVEYSDIDGSGSKDKYICRNFTGTTTKDSDRVYTSLNVNKYTADSSIILNTIGGNISSHHYSLNSGAYYLSGNYSGGTIEAGSTINCYVSEGYPMKKQQYWINEVVNVVAPNLTGVRYSPDGGKTWTPMVSDTMVNGYSLDNLGISISSKNSKGLTIKLEYDNGSYKYVTNYVSINSGDSPYSSNIEKQSFEKEMSIYNDSSNTIRVSKIGVNNDTIYVYWEQGINYDYYLMSYNSDNSYRDKQQLVDNSWNDIQITGDYFLIGKYQGATQEAILYANTSNYTDGNNVNWYVLDTTGTNVGSSGSYKILNTNNLDKIYWNKLNSNIKGGLSNRITVKNASDDSTITTIKENYSSNIQLATSTDIYVVNNVNNNTFKLTSAATVSTELPNNYSFYNTLDHANATYNLTVPAGTWDLDFSIGPMKEILLNATYYNS